MSLPIALYQSSSAFSLKEMYSGMHEELGGHARGNLRSYRGHQSRGRGRGGLHPRGRGTRGSCFDLFNLIAEQD